MTDGNRQTIEEFRANEGRVGGFFEGKPILLLHHRGAKTGTGRVNAVMYKALDDGYAIFGSKGGADTNPDWYHNLKANPEAEVEMGTETFRVRARVADSYERRRIWDEWKKEQPHFAGYEQKTSRQIPVVILERI
jgi:deazaflavin-dependent oxidoreductase (nitroreductase family)